jgi:pimeloyl-ACP methyl ester carboxylesterase
MHRRRFRWLLILGIGLLSSTPWSWLARAQERESKPQLVRSDFTVPAGEGIDLFVREVWLRQGGKQRKVPVLLLHGARVPGIPSFDLQVPGGSLAADLARAGHPTYIMDARGYGRSTRPPEMSEPPSAHPPLVRSSEVVRDVAAVVDSVLKRSDAQKVALLGWATGGHWFGHYATLYPDKVSHLILYNTLYGVAGHPLIGAGSSLEDPDRPGQFNEAAFGAYRLSTAESLLRPWDRSIPTEDKTEWRDPAVASAYVAAALASDPTSESRTPPSFRAPSGALEDSFYLATGRQLWDASLVRSPTLILASERDFWSRPEDRERLVEHLIRAPVVRVAVIPDATHYVHLDRPERGRARFLKEVLSFLAESEEGEEGEEGKEGPKPK